MFFRQLLHDERSCASYLVGCPSQGLCAVVDPQGDLQGYIDLVERHGMRICAVLETHLHADHLSTARDLAQTTKTPLYLGPGAEVHYEHTALADGQTIDVGNRRITAIHTPGHTPEHVGLLVDDWFLLTGDTLFVGDVGRVDLAHEGMPQADIEARALQLYHSLQHLLELPDWTEIYPGHYAGSVCGRGMDGKPISTIGRERRYNQRLHLNVEQFVHFQTTDLPPVPENFHAFKARNLGLS